MNIACTEKTMNLSVHTVHITEVFSHFHHQLRSQPKVFLHLPWPQVQVAILHSQRLGLLRIRQNDTISKWINLTSLQIINKVCSLMHGGVTRVVYFGKFFNLKRQLPAHVENFHVLSQDLDVSCRHSLYCAWKNDRREHFNEDLSDKPTTGFTVWVQLFHHRPQRQT